MTRFAYFDGSIQPIEQAKVSIMTQTFNYRTGCFGGTRGYWNAQQRQLFVFRLVYHYRPFLHSAKLLLAQFDYSAGQLAEITVNLLQHENWQENCYIGPITSQIRDLYFRIVPGNEPKCMHWLTAVPQLEPVT